MSRAERDMSADAGGVRLWRYRYGPNGEYGEGWDETLTRSRCPSEPMRVDEEYVAYPAAQAAAMLRVCEAVKPAADWLESGCYCPCCEQRNECVEDCTYADDAPAEWARMVAVREVAIPLIKAIAALDAAGEG